MTERQSKPNRTPFEPPSMDGKGCVYAVEIKHGRRVTGTPPLNKRARAPGNLPGRAAR
jgi:hypothetical protein